MTKICDLGLVRDQFAILEGQVISSVPDMRDVSALFVLSECSSSRMDCSIFFAAQIQLHVSGNDVSVLVKVSPRFVVGCSLQPSWLFVSL